MRKNKATQKEAIFYQLYKHFKSNRGEYIPVFKFMGEVYIKELGIWGFVSHEVSARCSELKKINPELIQSIIINAKSGAKYYGYRINPNPNREMIKDEQILKFYNKLRYYDN